MYNVDTSVQFLQTIIDIIRGIKMNAVGNIGQFIINNQYVIEIVLLVLLALIIVAFLVNRLVFRKRRNAEIQQLNEKIHEIENEMKGIKGNAFTNLVATKSDGVVPSDGARRETAEAVKEAVNEVSDGVGLVDIDEAIQSIDEMIVEIQDKHVEPVTEEVVDAAEEVVQKAETEVEEVVQAAGEAVEEAETAAEEAAQAEVEEVEAAVEEAVKEAETEVEEAIDDAADVEDVEEVVQSAADEVPTKSFVEISEDDDAARLLTALLTEERSGPKYTRRDWNRDRHGNVYSEEMLRESIG